MPEAQTMTEMECESDYPVSTGKFTPFDTQVNNLHWSDLPVRFQINAYAKDIRKKLSEMEHPEELYSLTDAGYVVHPRVPKMTLVTVDGFRPLPHWQGPKERKDDLIPLTNMMKKAWFYPGSHMAVPFLEENLFTLLTTLSSAYVKKQSVDNRMLIHERFGTPEDLFATIIKLRGILHRYTYGWSIDRTQIEHHRVGRTHLVRMR